MHSFMRGGEHHIHAHEFIPTFMQQDESTINIVRRKDAYLKLLMKLNEKEEGID